MYLQGGRGMKRCDPVVTSYIVILSQSVEMLRFKAWQMLMYKCDQMWPLETYKFNNLSFLLFSNFFSVSIPQSIAFYINPSSIAIFSTFLSTLFLWNVILSTELASFLLFHFRPLKNQREQNYTVLKTRSNMMTVDGLKPGTTYVFRVRAKTDGGYGSYGGEIELETSHEGKDILINICLLEMRILFIFNIVIF